MKKGILLFLFTIIIFLLLFLLLFFAYFGPVKEEYENIAKLPSHDLTLFIRESGYPAGATYNGEKCRTKEDFMRILNHDMFVGSKGYCYFYDAQNKLFLSLSMDTHIANSDGTAIYDIHDYTPYHMYYDHHFVPLLRGLGLGPIYSWIHELSGDKSGIAYTIASSRYDFLYSFKYGSQVEIPVIWASLQLALAFALYLIPLIVCFIWRSKDAKLGSLWFYIFVAFINTGYYLVNYPWLSW